MGRCDHIRPLHCPLRLSSPGVLCHSQGLVTPVSMIQAQKKKNNLFRNRSMGMSRRVQVLTEPIGTDLSKIATWWGDPL